MWTPTASSVVLNIKFKVGGYFFFFFQHFEKIPLCFILTSVEKLNYFNFFSFKGNLSFFFFLAVFCNIFSLGLIFINLTMMYLEVFIFLFIIWS